MSNIISAEDWAKELGLYAEDFISSSAYMGTIQIIKEAQKQAEEVGFNKGLELAAEKVPLNYRQSILNLKKQ